MIKEAMISFMRRARFYAFNQNAKKFKSRGPKNVIKRTSKSFDF